MRHRASRCLDDRVLFLRSFLASPRQVGAILPTSRRAVRDMLDLADLSSATCVAELGAGTGVYTEEILARLPAAARLLAFEIDAQLAATLTARFADPRLTVVADTAENLEAHLDGARADVIVSALPFTSLPAELGRRILERSQRALAPHGVLLVLQYSPLVRPRLVRLFGTVRMRISPRNVPPAFLFACSRPLSADRQGVA